MLNRALTCWIPWLLIPACTATSGRDDGAPDGPLVTTTAASTSTTAPSGSASSAAASPDTDALDSSEGAGCLFCDAPNQACVDDRCVTTCQGQQPDPCGPDQVCDVMSGECRAPDDACTLFGEPTSCGDRECGPGSVCDGEGTCIPVAPCREVACLDDGSCWGSLCSCERTRTCTPPSEDDLNGDFSVEIGDLEFADDCTAWMVTLRSGTDFVRRLTPDGTLSEWGGVANLNMGEIKILKSVVPPAGFARDPGSRRDPASDPGAAAARAEGLGEVALTYTCCAMCGCNADPPQGVARLVEDDAGNPLPLVIEAVITQGSGPFGVGPADAGPFGLTWGIDRVLYVGNSTANGDLVTADLEQGTQSAIGTLPARITAGAPISAAHLLLAVEGGDVYRFNVQTLESTRVTSLGDDVTSLSQDAFDGRVYVGLRGLDVMTLDPWTGQSEPFETMPGAGRVTVSPDGQLWFSPVEIIEAHPIAAWPLADSW